MAPSALSVDRHGPIPAYLKASVFLAGLGVMAAEMTAPRLLAPSFGTTQLIWTNIIGTVLASLTLGAWLGGKLADRRPTLRAYATTLALAGLLLAAVPLASRPYLMAASAALAEHRAGTFLLSLVAVCLFFAPPIFLLGMIGPWAVRLAGSGRTDLGRVAGTLSGLSAFGSILGTFLASLVALPLLGTRATLLATAGLLLVTGAWGAFRSNPARVAALLLAAGFPWLGVGPTKRDSGQLYEAESLYQYVQVRRGADGWLRLYLNEGGAYHSVLPAEGWLTGGVWDYVSALPALATQPGEPLRVLLLGLAAGTMARQIDHYFGPSRELTIHGVEIDPEVVAVGRRFFEMDRIASLEVHVGDARPFVEHAAGPYDLIVADAYRQARIPFHMATREFFAACRARLAPGGVFVANVATYADSKATLDALAATLSSVFPHVARFERSNVDAAFSNFLYLGSDRALAPPAASDLPDELRRAVLPTLRTTWVVPAPPSGAPVFTDDRSAIELYEERALLREMLAARAGS